MQLTPKFKKHDKVIFRYADPSWCHMLNITSRIWCFGWYYSVKETSTGNQSTYLPQNMFCRPMKGQV